MSIAVATFLVVGCGSSSPAAPSTVTATSTIQASAAEQQQLDNQRAALDQRQSQLDSRESAISASETAAKANSFPGEGGTFRVGVDIQPGTYQSAPSRPSSVLLMEAVE